MPRRAALERLASLAALAAVAPSEVAGPRVIPAASEASLDVERLLRLSRVPSLSLAVVDGGRVTTRSYGVTTTGGSTSATPETVYAAASLTKLVCAYLVLDLVAEGRLSLDTPVGEYLPLPNPDDPRAGKLTARHLLSHSGGWRNWRFGADDKLTCDFDPGTRWQYSGEGYYFLQRIIERTMGTGIAQVARDRVFTPLGMTRSSLVELPALAPSIAPPHNVRGEPGTRFGAPLIAAMQTALAARGQSLEVATHEDAVAALKAVDATLPPLPNFLLPNGAASLLTTATDFGAFLRHLATARSNGGRAAKIVEQLMTPQVRCNEAVQWGQGAGLEQVGRRTFAWQWGDNSGYKAFYLLEPAREWAMAVFTNGERGAAVYQRVIRDVTGEDHPAFLWA